MTDQLPPQAPAASVTSCEEPHRRIKQLFDGLGKTSDIKQLQSLTDQITDLTANNATCFANHSQDPHGLPHITKTSSETLGKPNGTSRT